MLVAHLLSFMPYFSIIIVFRPDSFHGCLVRNTRVFENRLYQRIWSPFIRPHHLRAASSRGIFAIEHDQHGSMPVPGSIWLGLRLASGNADGQDCWYAKPDAGYNLS